MKVFDKIVKFSQTNDIGHVQKVGGTIAMGLSCLAFTGSVLFNKAIPSEQKEFLVSQELADGCINVGLFWVMTGRFNEWAKKKVQGGKIFPKTVQEEVSKIKSKLGENVQLDVIKTHLSKDALVKVQHFEKSFPALVSLSGSILAASIITPIVRNIIASKVQKIDIKPPPPIIKERPTTNVVKPLPMNSYYLKSSGNSLRV